MSVDLWKSFHYDFPVTFVQSSQILQQSRFGVSVLALPQNIEIEDCVKTGINYAVFEGLVYTKVLGNCMKPVVKMRLQKSLKYLGKSSCQLYTST